MAIGTTAALIGSAVIGAGASALGSSAQKKAANKAAQTATDNTAANNALAREIYGQNSQNLAGYQSRGDAAGNAINALLGLGGGTSNSAGTAFVGGTPTGGPAGGRYVGVSNGQNIWQMPNENFGRRLDPYSTTDYYGNPIDPIYEYTTATNATPATPQGGQTGLTAQQAQENAFAQFRDSTGYKFRLNEGADAVNANYAAKGLLTSGAAQKALLRYGQDFGSNEFGNYFNMLDNQQKMGLSGASALVGVGQSFVGTVSNNNNAAASAAANAALYKGQATANTWGSIANGLGNILGGSSYGAR